MTNVKITYDRRSFIKTMTMAGGGMMLGFSWLAPLRLSAEEIANMPDEWFELNGFLKISPDGLVTIMSPNPEIGQNVKTSMPMIVAEELDVDWKDVVVEQAPLNTNIYTRQLAGGSQAIRQGWKALRRAGATARHMLRAAAADAWKAPIEEVTTENSTLYHKPSGRSAGYGAMASAASKMPVPEEVTLKNIRDFRIVGTSRKNVDAPKIVTGRPLYGLDIYREGMLIAMIVHPPAFGMKLKSVAPDSVKGMPGIREVFTMKTYNEGQETGWSDTTTFNEMVVVVGATTWEVMNAKKALKVEWEPFKAYDTETGPPGNRRKVHTPAGLESTKKHDALMAKLGAKPGNVIRKDGDPDAAFKNAAKVIERHYSAPFLAHNTMEPMNFFAHVTADKAELIGPIQTPEQMEKSVAARLGLPLEKVDIQMTRMGGGFGRRLYGHFLVEAAVISQKMKAPVKLMYTREDDMSFGIYRPAYYATYRAALDAAGNLTGFHVRAGGVPESPLHANRFPAGAVDHYLAEEFVIPSNISVGAFRAPRSNFIAGVEQAFLDEVAEAAGKDPIAFRLELLERAKTNPVGSNNDYDAVRYAGVLELVREKSDWGRPKPNAGRGVAAYFCHNSYVAIVLDLTIENGNPVVHNVCCAVDCGIVVNPDAAVNLTEGGIVDGIGHALYSRLTFKKGAPQQHNFDGYRLIRHSEAPKSIDVHFVQNDIDPTGLGEPPFPPVFGALANALYKATGKRFYRQPFFPEIERQVNS
jgi:isoquinoline 1-oxidoreductase beta subunit